MKELVYVGKWRRERDNQEGYEWIYRDVGPFRLIVGEEDKKFYGYIDVNDRQYYVGKEFKTEEEAKQECTVQILGVIESIRLGASKE